MKKRAIILLSGGLDSATTLAIARRSGFEPYALSFDYGQRHRVELEAARRIARSLGVAEHWVSRIDLAIFGGSALTGSQAVPKNRSAVELAVDIPPTYVPARNTIFLAHALAWAEVSRARDVFIGVNAVDFSGYPDCRPEFISQFEVLANLATKAAVEGEHIRIHAPLLGLTKPEIIRKGAELGVDFSLTHSCYDPAPNGAACGECDACQLRREGFRKAGVPDPTRYAAVAAK